MKKLCILISFLGLVTFSFAQRNEQMKPQNDQLEFHGYTVKLIPADAGTYGYMILKETELIILQKLNPFSGTPMGLKKQEDAFKVARWQIEQIEKSLDKGGPRITRERRPSTTPSVQAKFDIRLSQKIADELKIDIKPNDAQKN